MSHSPGSRRSALRTNAFTRVLRRSFALCLVALAALTFTPGLLGTASAARSSKPKEIVVVGSKVKVESAQQERPARVIVEVAADRLLTDAERSALEAAVPELLDELCPRVGDEQERCGVEDMEAALGQTVASLLRSFDDLEVDELSVHIAARRDADAHLRMLAPVLLGFGLLRLRRGAGPHPHAPHSVG